MSNSGRAANLVGPGVMLAGILLFVGMMWVPERLQEKWSSFAMAVFSTGAGMTTPPQARRMEDITDIAIEAGTLNVDA